MKILIVGGGIGGLSTALACQHFGIDYEVFEAAPEIREVGAGIWVPPNAMQVMNRLGLAGEIAKLGKELNSISVGGPAGEKWYTIDTRKIIERYGFGTIAIHRARLQSVLYQAVDKSKIHTAKRLTHFTHAGDGVTLHFEDGETASGHCLVGADGLRSVVRKQLVDDIALRYSGQTCWRGIVKFHLPDDMKDDMIELWGKQPGQRFAYSHIAGDEVYYYATLATPAGGKDDPEAIQDFLHKHYDRFGTTASRIIAGIDPRHLIRTDLFDFRPIRQWAFGNVALLGDAAHATTPNLGQGAAQAIESAYVLSSCLKEKPNDIAAALKAYEQKRMQKARFIVNTSWKIGQAVNMRNPVGIALRNWLIRSTPDFIAQKQIEKAYTIDF
jgi:2-polyprenyl-6-methoxyphenol hydroxylase-like FAD-dependent oxidoreductase